MQRIAIFTAAVALAGLASGSVAQTSGGGRAGAPVAAGKAGSMTIRQASGGGAPHGPRTARQPTKRPPHVSQGKAGVPRNLTHATTSRGASGVPKGPAAMPKGVGTRTGSSVTR